MANLINLDAGQVFSGKPSGTIVKGYDAPVDRVPEFDPHFMSPEWIKYLVLWFIHSNYPLYLVGPSGVGKTHAIKQLASMLNYPVYEATGYGALELCELVGHMGVANGGTVWVDGELTAAMRAGGLFLFNEMDTVDPSVLVGLNSVLDGSALSIRDAQHTEVVRPAPGFRFVATANTNGSGDESGLYTGTLRQNAALQNRFLCVNTGNMSIDQERDLVAVKYPQLPKEVLGVMLRFADVVRGLSDGRKDVSVPDGFDRVPINIPFGTRVLLKWAHAAICFETLKNCGDNVLQDSLMVAIGSFQDTETGNTLKELLQRISGEDVS